VSEPVFLSRFTPSLTNADALESMFVQRGDLAEHLVEKIRESVLTPAKHHALIIGPRGTGKTHLLSIVHNRIVKQEDLESTMRVAWLWEDEWSVASYLDLLLTVLRSLAKGYADPDLEARAEELFTLTRGVAERKASELLRSYLDGRTLVLIAENLDDLFDGLGKKGQQQLRSFLQEEGSCTILASAQGIFKGISLHASPFYGFFDIQHLAELTVDDAVQLVTNIAVLAGNEPLAEYVQSSQGKDRIRAVRHLAGGNHRIYVILSEFLTRESLDQLVDPFLRTIDDLTPYYQSRMAQLSPQQRKIIDFLCEARGAIAVKQIASRCFISPQTASSQLKDLRERGFVRVTPIGRDSYYEVAEPLMRIALEVKKQRGGPVRLFLEFLRHWYDQSELEQRLREISTQHVREREYLAQALQNSEAAAENDAAQTLLEEYFERSDAEDFEGARRAAEALLQLRASVRDWVLLGDCFLQIGRADEALAASEKALSQDHDDRFALGFHAVVLAVHGRVSDAFQVMDRYIEANPDDAAGYSLRASMAVDFHDYENAFKDSHRALALDPQSSAARYAALCFAYVGQFEKGLRIIGDLVDTPKLPRPLRSEVVHWLCRLGRHEDALPLLVNHGSSESSGMDLTLEVRVSMGLQQTEVLAHRLDSWLTWAANSPADSLPIHQIADMLRDLFWMSEARDKQSRHARLLWEHFESHGMGVALGAALGIASDVLIAEAASVSQARQWEALWANVLEEAGVEISTFAWMRALVHHRISGDERELLSLPGEERSILTAMIATEQEKRRLRALWRDIPDLGTDLPTD
jgi:tetratricopeptide (TPR) repeat protein